MVSRTYLPLGPLGLLGPLQLRVLIEFSKPEGPSIKSEFFFYTTALYSYSCRFRDIIARQTQLLPTNASSSSFAKRRGFSRCILCTESVHVRTGIQSSAPRLAFLIKFQKSPCNPKEHLTAAPNLTRDKNCRVSQVKTDSPSRAGNVDRQALLFAAGVFICTELSTSTSTCNAIRLSLCSAGKHLGTGRCIAFFLGSHRSPCLHENLDVFAFGKSHGFLLCVVRA